MQTKTYKEIPLSKISSNPNNPRRGINLKGQKFGRLIVLQYSGTSKSGHRIWMCRCDCGNITEVKSTELRTGGIRSCGCLAKETARKLMANFNYKHGDWHSRLHRIWIAMKGRCFNPNQQNYKYYGGRGITVCPEWRSSYLKFKKWALANGYADHLTIDRIDNDDDYSPQNCQWLSRAENSKKQYQNHISH